MQSLESMVHVLRPMLACVSVSTAGYRRRASTEEFPPQEPAVAGGTIGPRKPRLRDIHWLTHLSAPYRRYIPDAAVSELTERFGFASYEDGSFQLRLLPDPIHAMQHPDELEAARTRVLELIGPSVLEEVPPEVMAVMDGIRQRWKERWAKARRRQ